jgi:hypothetical protein
LGIDYCRAINALPRIAGRADESFQDTMLMSFYHPICVRTFLSSIPSMLFPHGDYCHTLFRKLTHLFAIRINVDEIENFTKEYQPFSVLMNPLLKLFYTISSLQIYALRYRRLSLAAKKFSTLGPHTTTLFIARAWQRSVLFHR